MGMRGRSSSWDGIYMFIDSHGWMGWLAIRIIWRKGEMSAGVGILDRLPWSA